MVAGCLSPVTGTTTLSPNREFFAPVTIGTAVTGLCDAVGVDPDLRSRIDWKADFERFAGCPDDDIVWLMT
jgi:hypothetical protein